MCTLHDRVFMFMAISPWILLRRRNASDKSCRESQNTHFMSNNFFFRKTSRLWHDDEKCGGTRETTDDNIKRSTRFPCWINNVTSAYARANANATAKSDTHARTHSRAHTHARTQQYVILIFFPRQQWFRTRASMLRYTNIVCIVITMMRCLLRGTNWDSEYNLGQSWSLKLCSPLL